LLEKTRFFGAERLGMTELAIALLWADNTLVGMAVQRSAGEDEMIRVSFRVVNMGVLPTNKFWGETERVHPVSASCTLLESGGKRLLVDPSPRPPELAQLLYDHAGLRPESIDQIFLTHWHGDHLFGIELFPNAECLMSAAGIAEWRQQPPQVQTCVACFQPAEGRLPDGIQLFPSPGHTLAHCSLLAETPWGSLIVAGDAVMTPEYFAAEEGYRNAVDFALSTKTIRAIKATAALVIPGHSNLVPNSRPV
jgi:glyoxylase-like metal-dependent hydrolase (beta-lactamase superfamily II)